LGPAAALMAPVMLNRLDLAVGMTCEKHGGMETGREQERRHEISWM